MDAKNNKKAGLFFFFFLQSYVDNNKVEYMHFSFDGVSMVIIMLCTFLIKIMLFYQGLWVTCTIGCFILLQLVCLNHASCH